MLENMMAKGIKTLQHLLTEPHAFSNILRNMVLYNNVARIL